MSFCCHLLCNWSSCTSVEQLLQLIKIRALCQICIHIHAQVVKNCWWIFSRLNILLNIHFQLPLEKKIVAQTSSQILSFLWEYNNQNYTASTTCRYIERNSPGENLPLQLRWRQYCLPELAQRVLKNSSNINDCCLYSKTAAVSL